MQQSVRELDRCETNSNSLNIQQSVNEVANLPRIWFAFVLFQCTMSSMDSRLEAMPFRAVFVMSVMADFVAHLMSPVNFVCHLINLLLFYSLNTIITASTAYG